MSPATVQAARSGQGLRSRFFGVSIWAAVVAGVVGATPNTARSWDVVEVRQRDYVYVKDVADFYGFDGIQRVSKNVSSSRGKSTSLRGTIGSQGFYINNVRFNLSLPVAEYNGQPVISRMDLVKILEPVLRPHKIRGARPVRTVVLDAGHGGHDAGAKGPYGREKDVTLDVAKRAERLLRKQGFNVVMTRSSDVFISLPNRAAMANKHKDAIFVSIHFNHGKGSSNGIETFALAPAGVASTNNEGLSSSDLRAHPGNGNDSLNIALAAAMHGAMRARLPSADRGVKHARFHVLRNNRLPSVLLEGGFINNIGEGRKLASGAYRERIASAIAEGVLNYKKAIAGQSSRGGVMAGNDDSPAKRAVADLVRMVNKLPTGAGAQESR